MTGKEIPDKYHLYMIVKLHLFIASAPLPPHYFNPPHNSHLLNWIKQLLDVSQRGFIVHVCDPVV